MGAEYKVKTYEIAFVDGHYETRRLDKVHLKALIHNSKVRGYKLIG